jgi:subtilisin family serine protease
MRLNRLSRWSASLLVVGLAACQQDSVLTDPVAAPSMAIGSGPTKYVISFSGAQAGDVGAAIERAGGKVRHATKAAGVATAVSSDPAFADRLRAAPGILSVTEDMVVRWVDPNERVKQASIGTNEPFFPFQWAPRSVHAEQAWDLGFTGAGARVAVLDGGLNKDHIEFNRPLGTTNIDVAHSASMVDGFEFYQDQDPDDFSHATHVSGIVAARDNERGTIGIAPGATIIGVKVLHQGSGSFGDIIDGIMYAATPIADGGAGAHIINMSLGATFPSGRDIKVRALEAAMNQATTYAHQQGVVVIASAGNGDKHGRGIDHDLGQHFTLPAQAAYVLAVSATAPEGFIFGATNYTKLASYSNFGTQIVDFAGPGGDFDFPDPDNYVFDMVLSPGTLTSTTGYFFAAGTSMSAPAVAGVAALIVEKNGLTKDPDAVEAKLRSSSDDLGAPGLDQVYGYGFVNAQKAVQ